MLYTQATVYRELRKNENGNQYRYLKLYYWYHAPIPCKKRTTGTTSYRRYYNIRGVPEGLFLWF